MKDLISNEEVRLREREREIEKPSFPNPRIESAHSAQKLIDRRLSLGSSWQGEENGVLGLFTEIGDEVFFEPYK